VGFFVSSQTGDEQFAIVQEFCETTDKKLLPISGKLKLDLTNFLHLNKRQSIASFTAFTEMLRNIQLRDLPQGLFSFVEFLITSIKLFFGLTYRFWSYGILDHF